MNESLFVKMPNILFTGDKGSGKDFAGEELMYQYGYRRIAFADLLKFQIGWLMHQLGRKDVFGKNTLIPAELPKTIRGWERAANEAIFWCNLHKGNPSIRHTLQTYGTETVRDYIHEDYWVNAVIDYIAEEADESWVITDCRYPNEAERLRELFGFYVIQITTDKVSDDSHRSEQSYQAIPANVSLKNNYDDQFRKDLQSAVAFLRAEQMMRKVREGFTHDGT